MAIAIVVIVLFIFVFGVCMIAIRAKKINIKDEENKNENEDITTIKVIAVFRTASCCWVIFLYFLWGIVPGLILLSITKNRKERLEKIILENKMNLKEADILVSQCALFCFEVKEVDQIISSKPHQSSQ